jgi:hypothetical protein
VVGGVVWDAGNIEVIAGFRPSLCNYCAFVAQLQMAFSPAIFAVIRLPDQAERIKAICARCFPARRVPIAALTKWSCPQCLALARATSAAQSPSALDNQ